MNPVIIFILLLCLFAGAALFYIKKREMKNRNHKDTDQISVNKFINVIDIKDRFLYTSDGHIIMYMKINPISIDLLSEREKKQLCKTITAELSSENKPFKFIAVSKPVDISPLIAEYSELISITTDAKQKDLLRNEMLVMSNYVLSGEVVERQFYIIIWEKYEDGIEKDISKRCCELLSKFESGKLRCEILKEHEIVRLCNLINNPAYSNIEDAGFERTIPILMD
ncbi:UNVERIFIED_CONTAM: hypothetical protein Cloal_0224 [Acetivibrio alkalicellulosi]